MLSSADRRDDAAQIALLDAMVFFVITLLICAVHLSALKEELAAAHARLNIDD